MKNEVNRTLVVKKKITLFFIILLSFLTLGAWNNVAWGNESSIKKASLNTSNNSNREWDGLHVRFKLSGQAGYNKTLQALNMVKNRDYTLSWTVNENCTIKVTSVYAEVGSEWGNFTVYVGSASGTIKHWTTGSVTASGLSLGNNSSIVIKANSDKARLYEVKVTYTITPDAPGAVSTEHTIYVTLNNSNIAANEKLQINTSSCFTVPANDAHFYNYLSYFRSAEAGIDATSKSQVKTTISGDNKYDYFNATQKGKYFVKAKISSEADCHEASNGYSGNITINVVGHPSSIQMNDGEVFVKVAEGISASQLDLNSLIKKKVGEGDVSYMVTSANKINATISGSTFSATECGEYTISASVGVSDKYEASTTPATFKVTVKKITPTITTLPTASEIDYLQTLANSNFTGGAATWNGYTVDGSFYWIDENIAPATGNLCAVGFTPSDLSRFNPPTNTNVNVPINPIDQYITWNLLDGLNPREKYYEYATGETFDATSYGTANNNPTGLKVTYSSSNPAFATITDGNKLNVVKSNEVVTITATCVDLAGNWNDAVSVSKTFKTCGAKPDTWSVTASALTYGQLLSESELSGVVKLGEVGIDGALEWVEPTTMPNAGPHNYTVLFTPENEDAFGSITFDVEVSVAKADPTITWNIGERLRENSRYSNFVVSTNTEAALNTSVSNTSLLSVEGNVLTTGAVTGTTNGWIKVSQPASDNYNAVPEQTLNVTINPKSNVCLPLILDENKFNDAKESSVDKVSWCSTNEEGTREDYILHFDVRYTQRVGIALGSWDEGLSGLSWTKFWGLISGGGFEWSPKSVDLSFTGVPDKISFDVESQKVTSTPPDATWKASATDWYLYESADGVNYTQVGDKFISGHQVRDRQLQPTTRYIRIKYSGNFTGFVKDLQITQKKYLRTDKSSLEFGTEANPLQEPQTLTLSYSSLGSCEEQSGAITATIDNSAFYVDEPEIVDNVGIDQMGEYTIRVRCNDVNQEGTLTLTAYDGTQTTVSLRSTKPTITTAHTDIFQTGTEHAVVEGEAYRAQQTIDYIGCFSGSTPVFDTLYIYGVTASSASNRLWENDAIKGYKVPALNVAKGNVHTPCFVYAKSGAQYEYIRTFDAATGSLDIDAAGKKLGFIGYKPVNATVATPAIQLSGATEIYLNNAEIVSKGSVMVLNGANTIHARGNNTCSSSNAAAIQMGSTASELTIEDSWTGDATPGKLVLKPTTGKPSIDLNGANSVTINGTQLELHNAVKMAIVHMDGNTEKTDGSVKINDGTITGESSIGLPQNTIIDGGTFNDGTIVCYNHKGKTVRPFNSRDEVLARAEKEYAELPDWYGKSHLVQIAGRVYPMLYGGEGLCIFEDTKEDHNAQNNLNWTENPVATSDAIIAENMEVNGPLTVNSMTINEGVTVVVKNGATLTIGDGDSFREQAGNLHIENGGKVVLTTGELVVNDFILDAALGNTSQSAASGQLLDANNMLRLINDAYFQISFDPNGAITYGWYDFTVPFEVDLMTGVFDKNGNKLTYNTDYAVMEYSEAKRAAKAARPWTWFSGTMQPGKLYTITLDDEKNWNTFLFKKKANTAISINDSFNALCTETADTKDKGWNGLGNGMLQHCQLNNLPAQTKIQICDHENERYVERDAADYTYAVGTAFFVQVKEPKTIDLTAVSETRGFLAPMRENKVTDEFRLALIEEGQTAVADHLWVSANEEANGEYVIGRDLLKMGTPTNAKVAQMWASRNEMILCDAEMPLIGNEANVNVSFFAPKNGVYTIGIEKAPEDANLYLTYNDQVIWDLTLGAYTLELAKGTTTGYGLRIEARTPQVATGIESTATDTNSARKVLINNTLYIVTPEGKMYDAVGKSVK